MSACEAVIRSIERGVLDREMREHPKLRADGPAGADDRSMFEPRLLTEEEAQWRAVLRTAFRWSASSLPLFSGSSVVAVSGLTAEDHLCDDKGNAMAPNESQELHC